MPIKLSVKKFFNAILLTATLTFAACSNITSVPQASSQDTAQTQAGTLSGRISIGSLSGARTAFPAVPPLADLDFEVTAKLTASPSTTATGSVSAAKDSYSISLSTEGEWEVTIKAKQDTNILLSKTEEIDFPDDSSKDFILEYYTTTATTGSVALPISFEDTLPISFIGVRIDDATTPIGLDVFDESGGVKKTTYTNTALSVGAHKFQIQFLNSAGHPLYSLVQKVNVYPGLTTNKFDGPESYIDNATGAIKITAAHLAEAELTTFYVDSTYTSYGGKGTYFDPVKTLKKAVDLVNSSTATPASGFKIIVKSAETTEDNHIVLNAGKTLTVESSQAGTKRKITGVTMSGSALSSLTTNSSVEFKDITLYNLKLKVESETVTMTDSGLENNYFASTISYENGGLLEVASGAEFEGENLTINAGKATDKGGAIYSEGTVTLTDCTIKSSTAQSGGAIYSSGSLSLTRCTVSENKATVSGGAIYAAGTATATATVEMENCTIGAESPNDLPTESNWKSKKGNYSAGGGGGIMLGDYSSLIATGSKINGNYAASGAGGAINTDTGSHIAVQITNGEIHYNKASGDGGGLQIYSQDSYNSFVKNTTIKNNTSGANGGAISVTSGKYFTVDSCTDISGNTATGSGKGCYAAGKLTLANATYIADGIYLNTYNSPLTLADSFAQSGTDTIPLSYNASSFDADNAAKYTLIKSYPTSSLTSTQCNAFALTSDHDGYSIQYVSSSHIGKLVSGSGAGTTFEVGTGKTYETLEEAINVINTMSPASVGNEYEIKICEDLTLTQNITIDAPYVKITSDDDTTHRSISGGGTPTYGVKVTAAGVQFDKVDFTALLGGINVASGDLTLNNSKVENGNVKYTTSIENYAAGITVQSGATLKSTEGLIIKGCDNNTEANGHSGIYNNGGTIELTGTEITDCDNSKGSGGAIYCKGSTGKTILTNCNIHHNSTQSSTNGGAIYCYNGAEVELKGTTAIHDNTAWESTACNGGGIAVSNGISETNSKFTMESTVRIYNNKATGGHGGGIYVASGTVKLILDSSAPSNKDTGNETSTTEGSALCYISSNVIILSGSNINGTSYDSDTTLSDILKRN
ncbi:MAG: hypothetical protein IJM03_07620 [Treponema sp.]|nr:hypothetical protein [Treponema sp.]